MLEFRVWEDVNGRGLAPRGLRAQGSEAWAHPGAEPLGPWGGIFLSKPLTSSLLSPPSPSSLSPKPAAGKRISLKKEGGGTSEKCDFDLFSPHERLHDGVGVQVIVDTHVVLRVAALHPCFGQLPLPHLVPRRPDLPPVSGSAFRAKGLHLVPRRPYLPPAGGGL